jgi:hypothetical protein
MKKTSDRVYRSLANGEETYPEGTGDLMVSVVVSLPSAALSIAADDDLQDLEKHIRVIHYTGKQTRTSTHYR